MSNGALSMGKLKSILPLKCKTKRSHRPIARSLSISPSVVSTYINRAAQRGVACWPLPRGWDDIRLDRGFLKTQVILKPAKGMPDWGQVHPQRKGKGVTRELLWQEYTGRQGDTHYRYNPFCRRHRAFKSMLKP